MMKPLVGIAAVALILWILWDAFEVVVLPRRVTRRIRWSKFLLRTLWKGYSAIVRRVRARARRESYFSFYGPLSVILLLGTWAVGLIVGFGELHWALGSRLSDPQGTAGFGTDLYMSGTTFFTLGLGDVVPRTATERAVTVVESGLGFGFLALVISYLPVLYQSFSRREVRISLLDAWAGSPPSAGELLRRLQQGGQMSLLTPFLQEWELWSAELLEAIISYPTLAFFRSQHDNQSWLGALTMVMDTCALTVSSMEGGPVQTARHTFAMARHAVVDICQILNTPPRPPAADRLPPPDLQHLRAVLGEVRMTLREDRAAAEKLAEMRLMYEPYVNALAQLLLVDLPAWMPLPGARDNWQRTPWR